MAEYWWYRRQANHSCERLSDMATSYALLDSKGKNMKIFGTLSMLLLTAALCANAQDEEPVVGASTEPFPCEQREEFGEFDFWLGEWDVHVEDGTFAGANKIEKTQAGCVVLENWVGVSGNPGMSINYFDIAASEWVQVWNSAGGTQIDIRGGLTDDGMLLEGQINYVANGTSAPFRGLWTLLSDGRVRQFFEQYDEDAETWAPWFEGFYTRTNVDQQASEK